MKTYIVRLSLMAAFLVLFPACELERLPAATEVAPGGGTLTTYTAYSINSTDPTGTNVNGRIVFWKTSLAQTLVQISLYNTVDGLMHPALLISGPAGTGTTTMMALDNIDGSSGEFSTTKLFLISDTAFYDSITTLDAHVSIALSIDDATIVSMGDIGTNADPVAMN